MGKIKHGKAKTPEFNVWVKMRQRCYNPNSKDWSNYGGRGILVCPEWNKFSVFYADMGRRDSDCHQLERLDNNAGYCKANCKWASRVEQSNNRRSNCRLIFNGRVQSIAEWAREVGIRDRLLRARIFQLNWTVRDALTNHVRSTKRVYQ